MRFRLTFLVRFTLVTFAVAVIAAVILAFTLESAHQKAIESDEAAAVLSQVSATAGKPLVRLAKSPADAGAIIALGQAIESAKRFEFVSGVRIYSADGASIYPRIAPPDTKNVMHALTLDEFEIVQTGPDTRTQYAPFVSGGKAAYVFAIDYSINQMRRQNDGERNQVYLLTLVVVGLIFASLVTLAAGASREIERLLKQAQNTFLGALKVMAETIDLRDTYTAGHSRRVAEYSRKIAHAMKLPANDVETIESAAALHDLGKIGIPDNVLFKPAALDARERRIIGTHPKIGATILEKIPSMEAVVPCVLHHHEHVDGSGYPDHLTLENIPLGARIIAVADAFDAMTTNRPYRDGMSVERAMAEIHRVSGKQLDPRVVTVFSGLVERGEVVPPPSTERIAFGSSYVNEVEGLL